MRYLVLLLTLAFLSSHTFANTDLDALKLQVRELQTKVGGNNLKLGVDFRSEVNQIDYTMADGSKHTQDSLLANRLWINMGYKYNSNLTFKGKLSYYKMYGQDMGNTTGATNQNFDWVASSNPNSDKMRVKEAYLLYTSEGLFGMKSLPWIFSVGRRPSTGGMLANHRNGDAKAASPLAHNINMEFDGVSITFQLDKLIPVQGMDFKICAGRGTTAASPRFSSTGTDYIDNATSPKASDLIGFIFTPYNNGQYLAKLNMFVGKNLIGNAGADTMADDIYGNPNGTFYDFGDMSGGAFSFEVSGIGDMINDFLDDTTFFASYAWSKTDPTGSSLGRMLGSPDKESGASYWFGLTFPIYLVDGDRFGFEYNHGDKYWRSFTYGEDTLAGQKLGTRGSAIEFYYNVPLIDKALTAQIRFTQMKYDFAGSNGFFGDYGTPMTMAEAVTKSKGGMVAEEAQIIRASLRYNY